IQDLFKEIENGNACVYNGANSTYIKWVSDKVDINGSRITEIIANAGTYKDDCTEGNVPIE
ncbi:MAG: hypothetical protein WCF78_01845, partial [archaeon]